MAVVVLAELLADGFELSLVGAEVHGRHGLEICCVEARRQDRVLGRIFDGRRFGCADGCCGVGCGNGWRHHRVAVLDENPS